MWPHLICMILGIWLMIAPELFGYVGPARANDYIVGPMVAALGCIALWEVTRPVRWGNFMLGAWLFFSPWILGYSSVATINSIVVGLMIMGFARLPGRRTQAVGGGWSALRERGESVR